MFKSPCELYTVTSVRQSSSVLCLGWCPLSGSWCHTSFQDHLVFKNTLKMIWSLYLLKHCINTLCSQLVYCLSVCASLRLVSHFDKKDILWPLWCYCLHSNIIQGKFPCQPSTQGEWETRGHPPAWPQWCTVSLDTACRYCRCIGCVLNCYTKITETV